MKNKTKNITDEIPPKFRKRFELLKRLTIEEHWVLYKSRNMRLIPMAFVVSVLILYFPIELFITALEMGNTRIISYMVMIIQLYSALFLSIGIGFTVFLAFYILDKTYFNYYSKANKIIKKIKKDMEQDET